MAEEKGLFDEMESDAAETAGSLPDDEKVRRISMLALRQVALERDIEETETNLKKMQSELDDLRDKQLSDLLLGCGVSEIRLNNGKRVKIDRMVFASIKGDNKKSAIEWLERNNFGSLVKYKTEVDIGKGETKKREEVKKALEKLGLELTDKTDIHPQTLKAFVKEQMENGVEIPQDLFGVFTINRCKIS